MNGRNDLEYAPEALMDIAFAAARRMFRFLSQAQIAKPPHGWFDASLARQVALHILVRRLNVPKRRAVEMQSRSREAVNRALRIVDARIIASPDFAFEYHLAAAQAFHKAAGHAPEVING